jgi:hypothetical protein
MADQKKQTSETSQVEQAKSDIVNDVAHKSHDNETRPVQPTLSARKPLFRS